MRQDLLPLVGCTIDDLRRLTSTFRGGLALYCACTSAAECTPPLDCIDDSRFRSCRSLDTRWRALFPVRPYSGTDCQSTAALMSAENVERTHSQRLYRALQLMCKLHYWSVARCNLLDDICRHHDLHACSHELVSRQQFLATNWRAYQP
jgi:hypothetical protein